MKKVLLIHNPTAGDEEHSAEKLKAQLEQAGYTPEYRSTKDKTRGLLDGAAADLIAIAGGDGTVRKVVKLLVAQGGPGATTLAVLPLGTANNIAKTFEAPPDTAEAIASWATARVKKVDIGTVKNVPDVQFFLEGMGFGIFPYLMKEMKKKNADFASPEEELKAALRTLHQILMEYTPRQCHLEIDGTDHSGKFYMVEVMNIRSIGPNVALAPYADPGDGELDVVLIPEAHKEKFADYLQHKLAGGEDTYQFHTLKGKNISIRWDGTRIHVDDEMLKLKKEVAVSIQMQEGVLSVLVPGKEG